MLLVAILLLQIAAPLVLLGAMIIRPPRSRAGLLVLATLWAGFLLAITALGDWTVLPWWLPYALAALSIPMLWHWRTRWPLAPAWPQGTRAVVLLTLGAVATGGCLWVAWLGAEGRQLPDVPAADLAFPLRGGTFAVASGGANALLDLHTATSADPRFIAHPEYRTDFVRLNAIGMRASGLFPADPARYAIFGTPVIAPCAGVVTNAEGSLPDLAAPASDPHHTLGNHVVLDCGGIIVTLAHLRQGSLAVRQGQRIDTGAMLAAVGNAGDSREPHLAVTAKRRGTALLLGGDAMPMRFDGRYLTRNQRHEN